jgi:hypothetical protein
MEGLALRRACYVKMLNLQLVAGFGTGCERKCPMAKTASGSPPMVLGVGWTRRPRPVRLHPGRSGMAAHLALILYAIAERADATARTAEHGGCRSPQVLHASECNAACPRCGAPAAGRLEEEIPSLAFPATGYRGRFRIRAAGCPAGRCNKSSAARWWRKDTPRQIVWRSARANLEQTMLAKVP